MPSLPTISSALLLTFQRQNRFSRQHLTKAPTPRFNFPEVYGCHPTHRRGTQALTGTETGLPPFSLWFCTRITAIGRDRPTGKSASAFQFPETFGKHCFVPESFSLIPAAQIFPDCPNCSQCLYLFQKFCSLPCFIATCICSTPDMPFRYFFQGIVLCVA